MHSYIKTVIFELGQNIHDLFFSLRPGGGGGHSPRIWVGVCSCGFETPTLNKGTFLCEK